LYCLCTLLKLNNYSELSFAKEIKKFVLDKAKKELPEDLLESLKTVLNKNEVGLLINERAFNLPPALIPPLFNILSNDIKDYKEDNQNDNKFDVEYILFFSK
jgi:hypothetical protein